MNKFKSMKAFINIVDHGSLTGAANHLGQSVPTMVRTLSELEDHLGVRLLNRTTRRIALTEEGREYLTHCRRIIDEIENVEHSLDRRKITPTGKLTITAPVMFGQQHIQPLLSQWLAKTPGLTADLLLLNRPVDLLDEGVDIALRIGSLADSSLIAMPLGHIKYQCCASPGLLKQRGMPASPKELCDWPAVTFSNQDKTWRFSNDGEQYNVKPSPAFNCNQITPILNAAVAGTGVVYVMNYQVAPYIECAQVLLVGRVQGASPTTFVPCPDILLLFHLHPGVQA
jgi:DNA-binding transcriptional LysR family regulator